jgi:PAS domain S-box-containing protein
MLVLGDWHGFRVLAAAARDPWWLRVLEAVVVGLALLAAHRHRTRSIQERSERLEREVHEREQARQALVRSERQLRLIADALPMMIAYVDAEGRVLFSNLASEEWFQRPRHEIEGQEVQDVLSPDVFARVRDSIELAQGGERVDFDLALGAGSEGRRRLSVTLVPHTEAGQVLGFYAFVQDVTERARIQEELHRQHDQLAHAARVSTLGEMATALAHELNQPLTAVLSNANAVLRQHAAATRGSAGGVTDEVRETLADIARRGPGRRDHPPPA